MLLNAILCVWNEEDIVASTVKHLFAQGCSHVFIIDNASTDNTIKNAIHAGAKVAAKFKTKYFSEDQKVAHLNAVIRYVNGITYDDSVWWLYVDADEFPHIEGGIIGNYVNCLDSSIRAVHGYMFDHTPTHQPYHVQGYHPIDFQPLCTKSSVSKIPLLRYDKGKTHLWSTGGAHNFISNGDIVPIVKDVLHIHHFPYRDPGCTFKRLKKLVDRNNAGMKSGDWYKEFSSQVAKSTLTGYEERYNQLHAVYSKNKYLELKTYSLPYDYTNIVRWYDMHIYEQKYPIIYEECIWIAMYYFFMKEYELAVCRFNDIFTLCDTIIIKLWLMVKIAECLAFIDGNNAHDSILAIKEYGNSELNAYIDRFYGNAVNNVAPSTNNVGQIDLYQSEFAPGVADKYTKMTAKIEANIMRTIRRINLSGYHLTPFAR